mmetsp:Transcript_43360/g.102092  ORF Transcript_43360/g.102092 Transcript_43360/m.102092 type:complete len:110 (+) Transcript_43360:284-613(+)
MISQMTLSRPPSATNFGFAASLGSLRSPSLWAAVRPLDCGLELSILRRWGEAGRPDLLLDGLRLLCRCAVKRKACPFEGAGAGAGAGAGSGSGTGVGSTSALSDGRSGM